MSGRVTVPIKEARVTTREYEVVEYTPDAIREIWSGDTAETSLVLALLERWEAAEAELRARRAADLSDEEREALTFARYRLLEYPPESGSYVVRTKAALAILDRLLASGGGK